MTPEKKRRKAVDIAVPDITDDAAERKRALNVLAQRRYRKRKREQVAALEAQLKEKNGSNDERSTSDSAQTHEQSPQFSACPASAEFPETLPSPPDEIGSIDPASPGTVRLFQEAIRDTFTSGPTTSSETESGFVNPANLQEFIPSSSESASGRLSESDFPSLPSSMAFDSVPSGPTDDLSSLTFQFLGNQMTLDQLPTPDLSSALQSHQSSNFSFPDDHLLEMPTLTLLRAMLTVATRLNLTNYIWNPNGLSPFYTGPGYRERNSPLDPTSASGSRPFASSSSPCSTDFPDPVGGIPTHLQPTPTQRLVPHHALLDLFPWPTTRDKLIQVFSVPAELRPPAAADPMALVGLVYDLEDPAEGMRVGGADPFAPEMWEVGQLVFERWWWAFEGSIVERSNRLRKERGKQGLVLGSVD